MIQAKNAKRRNLALKIAKKLAAVVTALALMTGLCGMSKPNPGQAVPEAPMQQNAGADPAVGEALSYEGYTLQWEDDFSGSELNRDDWNVELHDPGWVNNELQAYVDSEENIYLENGSLVIKPVEIKNADGTVSYTSGRVNTQNKQDFKYGIFEARVKVPEGQGFLPAFWMMPTNENLYGQ